MGELTHADHGELTTKVLNTRVHDNEQKIKCERCGFLVDELGELDDVDCDHYKGVRDGIMGNLGAE